MKVTELLTRVFAFYGLFDATKNTMEEQKLTLWFGTLTILLLLSTMQSGKLWI